MREILCQRQADTTGIKAAVFDFDGTISTLRCGWEQVMETVMLEQLEGGLPHEELLAYIRAYIDESTGIQTIYQMEWLAEQVQRLCGVTPLDPWDYKDIYNEKLLRTVNTRIAALTDGTARPEEYLVPGSREFLLELKRRGIQIYIASGTDDGDVHREAELLGIRPIVTAVKGAPYHRRDCSKEAVIRDILGDHGFDGNELLVVGDGKVEILLGREAGAVTIGVASDERVFGGQFHPGKLTKLKAAGADYIVADFVALLERLPPM